MIDMLLMGTIKVNLCDAALSMNKSDTTLHRICREENIAMPSFF